MYMFLVNFINFTTLKKSDSNSNSLNDRLMKRHIVRLSVSLISVIHFENGHYGFSWPLFIKNMSPKLKTMSPNFISHRNIKQAGICSKGRLFREWINWKWHKTEKTRMFRKFQKRAHISGVSCNEWSEISQPE